MKLLSLAAVFLITSLFTSLITPVFGLKETIIYLPAVEETDYGYEGVLATLKVEIKEGTGHVYVDTWPLTKIDTQVSARIAKTVACDLLYLDCSEYDFYYTIRSDAQIVGGPSGGAAMTIATLASLLDLEIDNNVLITGTINPDGSIGPVGGILEKAKAASKKGRIFLIPYGEDYVEREKVKKISVGPITIEESEPERIKVSEYAKKHWNLSVIEIKTIQEAFKYFTGYELKEPELEFRKTEKYQKVMKKLADELIERAEKLKEECESKLNNSKISYSFYNQILEVCGSNLEDAMKNYDKENYYSAASIAFSKAISYKYGIKLIEFLESEDGKFYLRDYLRSIEKNIFEINASNIELYAIIEERLAEVREKLDEGWKNYYNENYISSLNYASFADERLYTASLWMKYANEFPSYIKNESKYLKEIAKEMLSEASALLTYSSLTTATQNMYIENAKSILDKARENYREGNYYATIISCLKSKANAELASEILFKDKDYLIEIHRKRALAKINNTNSVIGQSYFEYAQTLENENKDAALIYYTYAEKLSELSELLSKQPKKESIVPERYIEKVSCNYEELYNIMIVLGFIIFLSGIVVGRKL